MVSDSVRDAIVHEFITQFNVDGYKVTLSSVSSAIHISKKTIYKYFDSKDEIYLFILKRASDEILSGQKEVYGNESLSTKEKLMAILTLKTTAEEHLDMLKVFDLKDHEPVIYQAIMDSYEAQWHYFTELVKEGVKDGTLKEDVKPGFMVGVLESSMEKLYEKGFLEKLDMSFTEAIAELAHIVLEGVYKQNA